MWTNTKKCYGLGATSPFGVVSERASEPRSREEWRNRRASPFFPCTLLTLLLSRANRMWLLSISLKWKAYSQARNIVIFVLVGDNCIIIIMAQSIPSLPITIQRHLSSAVLALWTFACPGVGNLSIWISHILPLLQRKIYSIKHTHKRNKHKIIIRYLKTAPLPNTDLRGVILKRWAPCFGKDVIEGFEKLSLLAKVAKARFMRKNYTFETREHFLDVVKFCSSGPVLSELHCS